MTIQNKSKNMTVNKTKKRKRTKTVVIRVRKVAPKRFLIEQRRKLLWLWEFWQKGCPTLGLNKFYQSKLTAKTAIQARAEKKGVRPIVIIM